MVEQVTAYRDSKGNLHSNKIAAARTEAKILLEKILGGGPAVVAVLERAPAVYVALRDYIQAADEVDDEAEYHKPLVEPALPEEKMEERYRSSGPRNF